MKKQIALSVLLLTALLLVGCQIYVPSISGRIVTGSGNVITEARTVSGFNGVSLAGLGELTMTQGDTESLTVQADDNLMPLIKTEVRGGTLFIYFDRDYQGAIIAPIKPVRFDLHVKDLSAIEIAGAANVNVANLKTDRLSMTVSGAGNIKLDQLDASEMTTTISGAGNLDVAGRVVKQAANLSGIGNYRAVNLNSQTAQITISGAGSATLRASESLDVSIRGAGSVNYYGNPKVTRTVAGVGMVKRLGDN